jgi:hypothetical protein
MDNGKPGTAGDGDQVNELETLIERKAREALSEAPCGLDRSERARVAAGIAAGVLEGLGLAWGEIMRLRARVAQLEERTGDGKDEEAGPGSAGDRSAGRSERGLDETPTGDAIRVGSEA